MFLGRYEHSINGQGRTSLPVKFRDELKVSGEDRLIITNLEECLVAYTTSSWKEFLDRLEKMPQTDIRFIEYMRFFVSGAQDCPIDKQGRMLIPPTLREHANLTKEIMFVGIVKKIEIWAKDKWEAEFKKTRGNFSGNMQYLASLGM